MEIKKKVLIIGAGWYGCHAAKLLKNNYDITIIEKEDDIFKNSSYYNQNRLHLGFHYCRDYKTRHLCQNYYDRFFKEYEEIIEKINNNYYAISNNSSIDYQTYINIYTFEKFKFNLEDNNILNNIDGKLISCNEQVINSDKAKIYFKNKLSDVNILYNSKFINYYVNSGEIYVNYINKNNDCLVYKTDILLDCTYNQLNLSSLKYKYELTISLLFKKKNNNLNIGAITIMDGNFMSLYPRNIENNQYTLTDVELTPIFTSILYDDVDKYRISNELIFSTKNKMIDKFINYYKNFLDNFEYDGYFLSKKTKIISNSDSRIATIEEIENNIITVNCGKIYGIYNFEDYIKSRFLQNTE
jgi:hypothetical protein